MMKIPLETIISKIKESTELSDSEIEEKIESKMKELSGLISKEGAAHIIANELGVKVFEQTSGKLQIKNIISGMRSVDAVGKVTRKFELREFKTDTREGKVASIIIGDETGTIRVVMWNSQADNINNIKEGDIVKVIGGYVRESQGNREIHLNDRSTLTINPEGESISEVKTGASYPKAQRKDIKDLLEEDNNVEILGTIVQAFDPRFFEVDPNTKRRIRPNEEGKFIDSNGKEVTPDYSYLMNIMIDDGTDSIRCTFFKNQMQRLLGKEDKDILLYKEDPSAFESIKNDLLGNMVKLIGKINKNEMFDRIEFIPNLVFTDPDPTEEIKRLQNDMGKDSSKSEDEKTEDEEVTQEVEKIN